MRRKYVTLYEIVQTAERVRNDMGYRYRPGTALKAARAAKRAARRSRRGRTEDGILDLLERYFDKNEITALWYWE